MAERAVASRSHRPVALRVRYRLTPWWVKVLVIFVASRVVSSGILLSAASEQLQNAWTGANPGYFDFAKMWDGHWYYIITLAGYPSELPTTPEGEVGESAWAFMPGYPSIVRVVMMISGLDFPVAAVIVSTGFALGTALVLYRLMVRVLPQSAALFTVVLYCVAPLSPLLQLSYAESMHAFFLTLALLFLVDRRYWMLLPVIAIMSLTRPSGLAFALALTLHVAWRWWTRARDPYPRAQIVASVVAAFFSGVMGLAWLLIAGGVTGSLWAYTDTELAWRAPYVGYGELIPFSAWIEGAGFWAPYFGMPLPLLLVLLAILVAGFFAVLFSPLVRRLGVDLRFWVASYALYLLAVFFPQSSTFRLLLPMFPLLGAVAVPRSPSYRIALVLVFIVGQWVWVHLFWKVSGYDWTPP